MNNNNVNLRDLPIHDKTNHSIGNMVRDCLKKIKINHEHTSHLVHLAIEQNWIYYHIDDVVSPILIYDPYTKKYISLRSITRFLSRKNKKISKPKNDQGTNQNESKKDEEKNINESKNDEGTKENQSKNDEGTNKNEFKKDEGTNKNQIKKTESTNNNEPGSIEQMNVDSLEDNQVELQNTIQLQSTNNNEPVSIEKMKVDPSQDNKVQIKDNKPESHNPIDQMFKEDQSKQMIKLTDSQQKIIYKNLVDSIKHINQELSNFEPLIIEITKENLQMNQQTPPTVAKLEWHQHTYLNDITFGVYEIKESLKIRKKKGDYKVSKKNQKKITKKKNKKKTKGEKRQGNLLDHIVKKQKK